MLRSARHAKILEIISHKEIETQEELCAELNNLNYVVTQATISRDMRELKLTKVLTSRGTYKYTVNNSRHRANNVKFNNAVVDSIVSVDYAGNNIVLKTYPGMAQAVASSVDALSVESILGCVGGDDTIIIVTRDEESSAEISEKIKELIKAF